MPRVLPGATDAPNEDGIAFYNRLIDCLLAADITPCVSENHAKNESRRLAKAERKRALTLVTVVIFYV